MAGKPVVITECIVVMPVWMQRVCVTRGVRIRVAAIFISELSLQSSPPQPFPVHFFSYKYIPHLSVASHT